MVIKENVQELLNENMDRKKFLTFTGTVVLGVLGVTGLLNLILKSHRLPTTSSNKQQFPVQTSGYGGSEYGE